MSEGIFALLMYCVREREHSALRMVNFKRLLFKSYCSFDIFVIVVGHPVVYRKIRKNDNETILRGKILQRDNYVANI